MASSTLIHPCSSHTASPLSTISGTSLSFASISYSKNSIFRSLTLVPQLGLASFSTWNGLRRNGFSISLKSLRFEKKRKYGGKGVFASLFGVGAPEALVIGVVALLVFGPKGLAEIAKNLGKTLRAFQPTIRELQEVSREFKSTLEKEIGLDELKSPAPLNTSLSSSPLSVAPPENSQATATELTIDATTTGSQETATPLAATTEDSQATQESPPAATTKDSQETARLVAASTQDSQAVATTPAATTEDSQPTVSSVQEVAVGSEVGTAV